MTRRNSRSSAQEAFLAPSPTTTPYDEKNPVERTEKQKTVFVQDRLIPKDELKELEKKFSEGNSPIAPSPSPADYRRAQEALFSPSPTTTPTSEKKPVERTDGTLTGDKNCDRALVGYFRDQMNDLEAGMALAAKVGVMGSPADIIREEYGIEPNCTNVPRLLYAILCEVVRGRV